jgi:hypothetical protein
MTEKFLLFISPVVVLSVCLYVYVYVRTPENTGAILYTNTTSSSTREELKEDTNTNRVILGTEKTPDQNIMSTSEQSPMHTEQFTLTLRETVHTKDRRIALTLTGLTLERDEPNPNLPHSPDPGIVCPSFTLLIEGVQETVSVCIATQGDSPNRNKGSVENTAGTVTLSVLDMTQSTTPFGNPEKIIVQIAY